MGWYRISSRIKATGYSNICLVDVWDAITSDRSYRKTMSRDQAYQYILSQAGKHFDPEVVELFISHIEEFEHLKHQATLGRWRRI